MAIELMFFKKDSGGPVCYLNLKAVLLTRLDRACSTAHALWGISMGFCLVDCPIALHDGCMSLSFSQPGLAEVGMTGASAFCVGQLMENP